MGLKERRNGRMYYYTSRRVGGRVETTYVGGGKVAEIAARRALLARERQTFDAELAGHQREQLDRRDREAADAFRVVGVVLGLVLEAAGFRQHARGRWRRTRMTKAQQMAAAVDDAVTAAIPRAIGGPGVGPAAERADAILEIIRRAGAGDESVRPKLRECFAAAPDEMLRLAGGNLAATAEDIIVRRIGQNGNLAVVEGIRCRMRQIREDLAGPDATPLERLLAERIALAWLDLYDLECQYHTPDKAPVSFALDTHRCKKRDRANRRFLQAVGALASVRRLGVGPHQYISKQQVNVAVTMPPATAQEARPIGAPDTPQEVVRNW